jgi:hypothetical protein
MTGVDVGNDDVSDDISDVSRTTSSVRNEDDSSGVDDDDDADDDNDDDISTEPEGVSLALSEREASVGGCVVYSVE